VSFTLTTFKKNLVSQRYLLFPYFFNVFSFGANKEDLLHVIHCVISSYPFIEIRLHQNYFNIHVIDKM